MMGHGKGDFLLDMHVFFSIYVKFLGGCPCSCAPKDILQKKQELYILYIKRIETATKLRDKKHPNIRILIIPKQDLAVDRQSQVINKQNQPIRQTTLYSKCYIKGLNWMYSTSNLKDTGYTGPFLFNFHAHM